MAPPRGQHTLVYLLTARFCSAGPCPCRPAVAKTCAVRDSRPYRRAVVQVPVADLAGHGAGRMAPPRDQHTLVYLLTARFCSAGPCPCCDGGSRVGFFFSFFCLTFFVPFFAFFFLHVLVGCTFICPSSSCSLVGLLKRRSFQARTAKGRRFLPFPFARTKVLTASQVGMWTPRRNFSANAAPQLTHRLFSSSWPRMRTWLYQCIHVDLLLSAIPVLRRSSLHGRHLGCLRTSGRRPLIRRKFSLFLRTRHAS